MGSPEDKLDVNALLNWFSMHQRSLPWRKTYDPYQVWVSEIMLQQTRVEQMLPHYIEFLEKFPDLHSLAGAQEQDVLKAWEGLGYYSRARHLHQAARTVVTHHSGRIPDSYEALLRLPGIGPYVGAAVSSIAFNQDRGVLDGNVFRVIARYFGVRENIQESSTKKQFQERMDRLLPTGKAREFNQAMMELGALVCVPQQPLCPECPLQKGCYAHRHQQQAEFPVKGKKGKKPTKVFAAVRVENREGVWLVRRSKKLLQGMWEFPLVPFEPLKDTHTTLSRKFREQYGVSLNLQEELGKAEHTYTHFHQIITLFRATEEGERKLPSFSPARINELPLSRVNHKLLRLASGQESVIRT